MGMEMDDETGQPRSDKDLQEATDEKDQLARAQYAYETGHPERELESTKPDRLLTLLTNEDIVAYSTKDGEYCQLAVDVGIWARDKTASIKEAEIKSWMKAFGKFRSELRNILGRHGIFSNLGWSDDEVLRAVSNLLESKDGVINGSG